jgi:hypothetical protein
VIGPVLAQHVAERRNGDELVICCPASQPGSRSVSHEASAR